MDLIFEEINDGEQELTESERLEKYRQRIYSIIHGGYNLLKDSKRNDIGEEIDGKLVTSKAVIEKYDIPFSLTFVFIHVFFCF